VSDLRDYQQQALREVFKAWREAGAPLTALNGLGGDMSAVCLVSPTGSGKTRMGSEIVKRAVDKGKRILWVAHRTELITQAAETLSMAIGLKVIEIEKPGDGELFGQVFVASIQTLLANGARPDVDLLVIDECHHMVADEWKTLAEDYSDTRILGLTATPTRMDNTPLGVLFGQMVNAVHYSELLRQGHLVDCLVYSPAKKLEKGIAQDPIEAYEAHAKGKRGFVYVRTKAEAEEVAERFTEAGYHAEAITDSTPKKIREARIKALKDPAGTLKILTNVYTLTEGVDVPCAEFIMMARNVGHISMYLQIVGRGLRPFPGKGRAIVIDLVGAMREHGFPTEDRHWDLLSGKADRGEVARYGVECPDCMAYFMRASRCPNCGHDFTIPDPDADPKEQLVYNARLECVTSQVEVRRVNTTPEAKRDKFNKLTMVCNSSDWSVSWAVSKYREEYNEEPDPEWCDAFMKIAELKMLVDNAVAERQHAYYVQKRYKDTFGEKPNFSLVDCEELKKVTLDRMKQKTEGKLTRKDRAIFLSIFGA
jgi:superfamily II DNA or RNA helicase